MNQPNRRQAVRRFAKTREQKEKKRKPWSSPVTMTSNPSQWIYILKLGNAALLILFQIHKDSNPEEPNPPI